MALFLDFFDDKGSSNRWLRIGLLATVSMCLLLNAVADNGYAEIFSAPEAQTENFGRDLGTTEVVILGLVEGVTELLPVSSTGHLILTQRLLGLDQSILLEPVETTLKPKGRVKTTDVGPKMTLREGVNAYIIIIQIGAMAAIMLLFRKRIYGVLLGLVGQSKEGLALAIKLLLAVMPAVLLALTFEDGIDRWLFNSYSVAIALAVGGIVLLAIDSPLARRKTRKEGQKQLRTTKGLTRSKKTKDFGIKDLTLKQALLIGCCQCLGLWPGMSRSLTALLGGLLVGLRPKQAAEFSFLLGLPTLGGAALYEGMVSGPALVKAWGWSPFLLGGGVAAFAAILAVRWLFFFLEHHRLWWFGIYRIALALVVLLLLNAS